MPDSKMIFDPLWRVTDTNGDPVSGAKLKFYAAGTSTPRTVYSDSGLSTSLGATVTCDSAGVPANSDGTQVVVYTGTTAYKLVITDADDVQLFIFDDVSGALDTSAFSAGGDGYATVPVSKTTTYSVVAGDAAKLIQANPTGGQFTITLLSAVTAGAGFRIGIRHDGTANTVVIATSSSQTIQRSSVETATSMALTAQGHMVWLVSDGAGWIVDIETPPLHPTAGIIAIADRLTTAPSSPSNGARYLINGSPSGVWSTLGFAANDIVEYDGVGSWMKYTPSTDCGWLAYVQDENLNTQYQGSAWTDLSNVTAPAASVLPHAVILYQLADGNNPAAITNGSWQTFPLNTSVVNTLSGASLGSNTLSAVPQGTYSVAASVSQRQGLTGAMRLKVVDNGVTTYYYGTNSYSLSTSSYASVPMLIDTVVTVSSATAAMNLEIYIESANGSAGVGAAAVSGNLETYGYLRLVSITTIQGPTGAQGAQGSVTAAPAGTLTLSNGANNDVTIGTDQYKRISGPSSAFSITGAVAPSSNSVLYLKNTTAQDMTLANESASSTAANRIITQTGADVTLTGVSAATLVYDTVEARWQLMSTQG